MLSVTAKVSCSVPRTTWRLSDCGHGLTRHDFARAAGGPPTARVTRNPVGYLYGATRVVKPAWRFPHCGQYSTHHAHARWGFLYESCVSSYTRANVNVNVKSATAEV
eukprot:9442376-Pyramimonas_sp.AAC.1